MEEKRLKVLFISSWYPHRQKPLNGIFVKRHAAANILDCDVSAIFICSDENAAIEESVEDSIYTIRGYYKVPKLKIFPIFHLIKLLRYLLLWKKVLSLYKAGHGKPDITNSTIVYPVSLIAYCIKIAWKVPYVITEHWTGYFPEDGRYKGFVQKLISRIAVAHAGAVITPSFILSKTMQSLGLKPEGASSENKYFTVSNVVDTGLFKIASEIKRNNSFNFIHISSLDDDQKNITGIIRTFSRFHELHPLSSLTVIGEFESLELKEKILNSRPKDGSVELAGKKVGNELIELLQKAGAFILFSNYENLPCVMLESFCCGIPVIGTKVGDVPKFINDKNGKLIDPKNEEQLLTAMEEVFHNSSNYNPAEIRNMVLNTVSPAAVSKQFTDIYRKVVTGQWSLVRNDSQNTPKLKVLFLSSWYSNRTRPLHGISIQRHAELLVSQCDVSVIYICSDKKSGVEIKTINGVYTLIVYFRKVTANIPLISFVVKLFRYYFAWKKALKIYNAEKGKPDIINSNIVYPVSIIATYLKNKWNVPYVITERWSGYFPEDGRYKGFLKKLISKKAVAGAGAIITPSNILGKTMQSLGLSNNYYTIPNIVDTELFTISTSKVRSSGFEFIHISSLTEEKNIAAIIRSFKKVHITHPQTKLTIIWDEEMPELAEKIKEPFSEKDGVFLLGKKVGADLAASLKNADAFVLFSFFETQSIVLLEALCCGIPVITSKCRGPEEYVNSKNGLLVEVNNESQLAEAMEYMIKNKGSYTPVEIRNSILPMVNKNTVAKKLIATYKEVLKIK